MITWRVKKIIYCSHLSLQSCHHLGSLFQQQIDLILPSLLSHLSFLPCSGYRYLYFFGLSLSILSNSTYTARTTGLIPSAQMLPYLHDVFVCSFISDFVWLDRSFTDILFTKSTNCSSFQTTLKCYCRFCKAIFYHHKCIVRQ